MQPTAAAGASVDTDGAIPDAANSSHPSLLREARIRAAVYLPPVPAAWISISKALSIVSDWRRLG
jgi:hypothetical protein